MTSHFPLFLRQALAIACLLLVIAGRVAADPVVNGLGWRPPTAAEKAWADEHLIVAEKVYLNQTGLDRVNRERMAQGMNPLTAAEVDLAAGDRMVTGKSRRGTKKVEARVQPAIVGFYPNFSTNLLGASPSSSNEVAPLLSSALSFAADGATSGSSVSMSAAIALPSAVDNSLNKWFPPIGSQGSLNSCVAFSTTYYTMTYMLARANNWDVTSGSSNHICSTAFTYNLCNGGGNNGLWEPATYSVMQSHGAPFLSDFSYDGNYRKLPTTADVWRNAIKNRMGNSGSIGSVDTPAGLAALKTMLANGYLLNMAVYFYSLHWTTVKYCPSDKVNNSVVGWPIMDFSYAEANGGHGMTIVGYDDTVWCDINGNGVVDPGEMGALKICNSWGTGYGVGGFYYVSYDSLKAVSSIPGANNTDRTCAFESDEVYWIDAKPAGYQPKLLAQFTLSTADRANSFVQLGYGATSTPPATVTIWQPGTTGTGSGECVFDFTDIAAGGVSLNWYLALTNPANDSTLSNFILTDGSGNQLAACAGVQPGGVLPQTATPTSGTVYAWAVTQVSDLAPPAAVTDLTVTGTGATQVTLRWTQPGNDGMSGRVSSYDLRQSTSPLTEANFSAATSCTSSSLVPGTPGTPASVTVSSLTPGTTYYFALKSTDAAGNVSSLSNGVTGTLVTTLTVAGAVPVQFYPVNGLPFSMKFQASGGVPPYRWSYGIGAAIPGLTMDPSTGVLSGIPSLTKNISAYIHAVDSAGIPQNVAKWFIAHVSGSGSEIVPGSLNLQVPMGGSVTLPVTLSQKPAGSVKVSAAFSSGDTDISITSGSTLTFGTANWNTPQLVTLHGAVNATSGGQGIVTLSASGYPSVPVIVTEPDPVPVAVVDAPPTLVSGPSAEPSLVTGSVTNLSALGADDNGESNLIYTWAAVGTPPDPVTFI